jgi:hypothetical protein
MNVVSCGDDHNGTNETRQRRITATVHLIHGSALALVDDNLGTTGNALHACERATRQLSALDCTVIPAYPGKTDFRRIVWEREK